MIRDEKIKDSERSAWQLPPRNRRVLRKTKPAGMRTASPLAGKASVVLFYFAALLLLCFLKLDAPGGSDLSVYSQIKYLDPSQWGEYRSGNYVSWYLLYIIFSATDGLPIGYSLAALDIFLWLTFYLCAKPTLEFNWRYAIIAMFSFAGVLFSYNILRQYIGTVFFLIAAIQFMRGNKISSSIFAILAAFSHFSAIFFFGVFLLSWITEKIKIDRRLLVVGIALGSYLLFSFYEVDKLNSSDLGDSFYELVAYAIVCSVFVFYFATIRLSVIEKIHPNIPFPGTIKNFLFVSFITILVISVTGAPIWLVNRLLLTLLFVAVCVTLSARSDGRRRLVLSPKRNVLPVLLLIPTMILHPGAFAMWFPDD